jgi:hypothetical protein
MGNTGVYSGRMGKLICTALTSLDGYIAEPSTPTPCGR